MNGTQMATALSKPFTANSVYKKHIRFVCSRKTAYTAYSKRLTNPFTSSAYASPCPTPRQGGAFRTQSLSFPPLYHSHLPAGHVLRSR